MRIKALVAASFAALLLYVAVFAQSPISGTVIKNANLRAGPGTNYAVVGTVRAGQAVTITEKNAAGTWFHLDSNKWIASFLVKVKETPSSQDNLPDAQGCYLFQNQLSAELTITAIRIDTNHSTTFKVPSGQATSTPACLDPGHYNYTIDAPPPWASINGELDVKAGDRYLIPVKEAKPEQANTPQSQPTDSPNSGQRYGAICRDGTQSGATGRGACSHHHGVDHWLVYP